MLKNELSSWSFASNVPQTHSADSFIVLKALQDKRRPEYCYATRFGAM